MRGFCEELLFPREIADSLGKNYVRNGYNDTWNKLNPVGLSLLFLILGFAVVFQNLFFP